MHALRQDLRFAVRMLAKSPGFAAVATLTLALGIGVNTAVFSIVTAVLLRALPYPDAERLVELNESHRSDPVLTAYGVSGPNFRDWRAASRSFANLGIHEWAEFWLREGGDIRPVRGRRVSADLLPTLGIQPMLGRGFRSEDEIAGGVALLRHEFWERQYGRDANAIGKTIDLIDQVPTVVGVLPPGFSFPGRPELLVPLSASGQLMSDRGWRLGNAVGRLKPGVSLRQAQAEMETIGRQLSEEYAAENKEWGIRVTSMRSKMIERVRPALPLMLGVATFVLLIAAANLGNLLLARATAVDPNVILRYE